MARIVAFGNVSDLGAYLGHLGTAPADQELPWIYGNPIYVTAPPT